jgi:glycosyltransferase involved in cell wall biosynthesis
MDRKPKVILFTNVGADLYGADYLLLCLIRSLDHESFRSIVLVPYDGPLVAELKAAGATVRVKEFPVLRRSVFNPVGVIRFACQMLTSLSYLMVLSFREKVDIFHTNTAAIWPPGIVATLLRKKHVWQIMELIESPRLVGWAMSKMTGIFSSKVFCISDAVRRHFLQDNPRRTAKFQTLYHGVDLDEYDPSRCDRLAIRRSLGISEEAKVAMYAGRFSSWKGQDVFAEALQILMKRDVLNDCRAHFIILGSCFQGQEEFERDLDARLNRLPNRDVVHRAGFQRNLPEWMAASDVFVLPSKRPEPNATVLIGAMAMGLACVGTNIGGTVETIVDGTTGILIPPDSPEAVAEALTVLFADPTKARKMGEAGRERALAMFSIERYCKTIRREYDQ